MKIEVYFFNEDKYRNDWITYDENKSLDPNKILISPRDRSWSDYFLLSAIETSNFIKISDPRPHISNLASIKTNFFETDNDYLYEDPFAKRLYSMRSIRNRHIVANEYYPEEVWFPEMNTLLIKMDRDSRLKELFA